MTQSLIQQIYKVHKDPTTGKRQGGYVYVYQEDGIIHKVSVQGKMRRSGDLPAGPINITPYLPKYRDEWLRYQPIMPFSYTLIDDLAKSTTWIHFAKHPRYTDDDPSKVASAFEHEILVCERIHHHRQLAYDLSNTSIYYGCTTTSKGLVSSIQYERLFSTLMNDVCLIRKGITPVQIKWAKVLEDITKGIDQLAAIGLIYTDIRSDNIMRDEEGNWKLIDFGDCLLDQEGVDQLQSGKSKDVRNALEKLERMVEDQCSSEIH